MLAVIETHPIQYHAPVYRALRRTYGIPVTAIYGSDFSVSRYHDREFDADVAWDVDLLSGYQHRFLSRVPDGAGREPKAISANGIGDALRAVAPTAVLIVGYSPAFHRHAWAAAWRLGVPILFRGVTTDIAEARRPLITAGRDAALRVAYRSCRRVLYIGARSKRHYLAHGVDENRLVFSPYCIDTTVFRASEADRIALRDAARAKHGIGADRLVLLFAGKLSARKGVDLICDAVRRLPSELRSRVTMVFAGDGTERDEIERQATIAPQIDRVMLGVQSQAALSRAYHMADVLALPSRHGETWGLVVNEALHHGVPCVVSDVVGCAPDLVDDRTGVVCEAGSVASLAEALERAVPLVARADVREHCREKVAQYSVDRAAAGIAEACRAVNAAGAGQVDRLAGTGIS